MCKRFIYSTKFTINLSFISPSSINTKDVDGVFVYIPAKLSSKPEYDGDKY